MVRAENKTLWLNTSINLRLQHSVVPKSRPNRDQHLNTRIQSKLIWNTQPLSDYETQQFSPPPIHEIWLLQHKTYSPEPRTCEQCIGHLIQYKLEGCYYHPAQGLGEKIDFCCKAIFHLQFKEKSHPEQWHKQYTVPICPHHYIYSTKRKAWAVSDTGRPYAKHSAKWKSQQTTGMGGRCPAISETLCKLYARTI